MYASPSGSAHYGVQRANTLGRPTYATRSQPPASLEMSHTLTTGLADPFKFSASSLKGDKKEQLEVALTTSLQRQFNQEGDVLLNEAIKEQVRDAIAGSRGTINGDLIKGLQSSVAVLAAQKSSSKAGLARTVLEQATKRALIKSKMASGTPSPYAQHRPGGSRTATAGLGGASMTATPRTPMSAFGGAGGGLGDIETFEAASPFEEEKGQGGAGEAAVATSPTSFLKEEERAREVVRAGVLSDPAPEKILGLVDEVRAGLEKKQEHTEKLVSQERMRRFLHEAEEEKARKKEAEKRLQMTWAGVSKANAEKMLGREQREKEASRQRELAQKEERRRQVEDFHERKRLEEAKARAQSLFQMRLLAEQDKLAAEAAAAEAAAIREGTKASLAENEDLLRYKKELRAQRLAEETQALKELQEAAEKRALREKEAKSKVLHRADLIFTIAAERKAEAEAEAKRTAEREAEDFREAGLRIAEAQRLDKMKKRQKELAVKAVLDAQAAEKKEKTEREKDSARRLKEEWERQVEEGARLLAQEKANTIEGRKQYRQLLEMQMEAKRRLVELEKEEVRGAVLEGVQTLPVAISSGVASRLAERAAAEEKRRKVAEAQRAVMQQVLEEEGLSPKGGSRRVGGAIGGSPSVAVRR